MTDVTSRTMRPQRSVLFMPGSNARAMEKARSLPADVVIFDLEDAVAPDAKENARDQALDAVSAGGYGRREVIVRVNAMATRWGRADLAAVATSGADAVLLPKIDSPVTVREALGVLTDAGAPPGLSLWCMLETPRGILNAAAIAACNSLVTALVMGTSDLTKEIEL